MREERFSTTVPPTVELHAAAGVVEIQTVDSAETTVVFEPLKDNEATLRAIDEARVELRGVGDRGRVLIEVPESARFSFADDVEVAVRVRAPHGTAVAGATASADVTGRGRFASVELDLASGDLTFDDVDGDVEVNSASGDQRLRRVGGDAALQSASGDITVGRVDGRATVRTASGDVTLDEAHSSVKVQTASGDQRVGVGAADAALQSASGDLDITVRRGTRLWIDARSSSGEVTSELAVGDRPVGEEAPVGELRATALSGDIRIRRA